MYKSHIGSLFLLIGSLFVQSTIGQLKMMPPYQQKDLFIIQSEINGLVGFADINGQIVIKPQFEYALPFSNGRALVAIKNKTGYIDATGKIVIPPKFAIALPFTEGLAPVSIDGKLFGFINTAGKMVIAPRFEAADNFFEGLSHVLIKGKSGYINKTGKVVIKPNFKEATPFKGGVAFVSKNDRINSHFIDKTGKVIKPLLSIYTDFIFGSSSLGYSFGFSEGLIPATTEKRQKLGYVDKNGRFVIDSQFEEAHGFSEGLAAARLPDGKFGYINKSGKFVIKPQFDKAGDFSEGVAAVQIGEKLGYINKKGEYIIEPNLYGGWAFSGGLAWASDEKGAGYINKSGKFVIKGDIPMPYFSPPDTPSLLEVKLNSNPNGAEVFLISLSEWEDYGEEKLLNNEKQMSYYQIAQGNTPVTTKAKQKVYIIVFKLNGRFLWKKLDVNPSNNNEASVEFK